MSGDLSPSGRVGCEENENSFDSQLAMPKKTARNHRSRPSTELDNTPAPVGFRYRTEDAVHFSAIFCPPKGSTFPN